MAAGAPTAVIKIAVAGAIVACVLAVPATPASAHTVTGVAPTSYRSEIIGITAPYGRDMKVQLLDLGRRIRLTNRGAHDIVVTGKDIREATYIACYLELNAKLQMQAMQIDGGDVVFLTDGEVDLIIERTGPYSFNRAWENWCRRAGRKML